MPLNLRNSQAATEKNENQQDTNATYDRKVKSQSVAKSTSEWSYGTEELLDGLPKVWTRSLLYFLMAFAVIGLPWAMLSKIDQTGSAKGRIEPKGATDRIDSQVSGNVTAVKVKVGDKVKTGQVLLQLDSNIQQTELQQIQAKLTGLQNQRGQLDLLTKQLQMTLGVQEQQSKSQALEKQSQVNQAKQALDAKQNVYNVQKLEKQALVNQVKNQIISGKNEEKSAQSRLSIDSKILERFNKLVGDGAVSINQVEQLRKEEQESKRLYQKAQSDIQQSELRLAEESNKFQATVNQMQAEIEQAKLKLEEEKTSYQTLLKTGELALLKTQEQLKEINRQISNIDSEINQTRGQIASFKLQLGQRVVRSTVDGMIYEIPVDKPGQVLQQGQKVAQIARSDSNFILKAKMPVSESAFLRKGMPVKMKFDAYPFQEYGIMTGQVASVSPNSKEEETIQGKAEYFELEVALDKPYLQSGNKKVAITPGQSATAEVIVRQRRIIDFMLDPFKQLQKGGLDL
ncbi:MAG: HlyD family secretion protein [Scytonematopsis contorta HA4267-MV1]|jgi:HlyD family secretion protein|nr:HlyD family secretion protein [Scytonematopsis contorta HA4267-MV1]